MAKIEKPGPYRGSDSVGYYLSVANLSWPRFGGLLYLSAVNG
jgi:hypothetical protein